MEGRAVGSRSQSPMAYASSRAASPYPAPPISPSEHGPSATEEQANEDLEGEQASYYRQSSYATFSRTSGEEDKVAIEMDDEDEDEYEEDYEGEDGIEEEQQYLVGEGMQDDGRVPSSEELSSEPPPQRSEGEWERIDEEIREMEASVEGISNYEVVDKLGEGTFSSVYKAIDRNHHLFDNYMWTGKSPLVNQGRPKSVYVALKRIYVTSSPSRILNELELMEDLRHCQHIAYLVTAFRTHDQIIAVMPYSRHSDFREYYRIMPLSDLKCYFRCLFGALEGAHSLNIIHRDVKPANFLYDPRSGEGTLCDFGLAERFEPQEWRGKCHHTCPTKELPHGKVVANQHVYSTHMEPGGALYENRSSKSTTATGASTLKRRAMAPPERIGYNKDDTRPGVRANRAGTRGFRAPEVLLKCQDQTPALDIWSAGIILLAFLTKRFPLFNSNDDIEALLELMVVFGKKRVNQAAILHNRTLHSTVPLANTDGYRIPDFILKLNSAILEAPAGHPDPELYTQEVHQVMDLARACLQTDLTRRYNAREALSHPFLQLDDDEVAMRNARDF